jgi:hypothetical protein
MVKIGQIFGALESVGASGTDCDGRGRFGRASRVKFCGVGLRARSWGV